MPNAAATPTLSPEGYHRSWRKTVRKTTGMAVAKLHGQYFAPGQQTIPRDLIREAVIKAFDHAADAAPETWRDANTGQVGLEVWQIVQLGLVCAFGEDVVLPRKAKADFREVMLACVDAWCDLWPNDDMESPGAKAIVNAD